MKARKFSMNVDLTCPRQIGDVADAQQRLDEVVERVAVAFIVDDDLEFAFVVVQPKRRSACSR